MTNQFDKPAAADTDIPAAPNARIHTGRRDFLKAAAAASAATLSFAVAAEITPPAAAQTLPVPRMEPKFVDVDGIRTRYFEAGSGQPLVLMHGGNFAAYASAYDFATLMEPLSKNFHVYAFDKLGMGFTDNPKTLDDYTMDAVIAHAKGFIRALGLKKIVMGGHSRGALPAARIACDEPDNVTHLVILDSDTLSPEDPSLPDRIDPPLIDPSKLPTREELRAQHKTWTASVSQDFITDAYIENEYQIMHLPKMREADLQFRAARDKWVAAHGDVVATHPLWRRNMGATTWWLAQAKEETLGMIDAGKLKAPTIIIWGFNDATAVFIVGVKLMQRVAKVVERSEFHMINHAAHFAFAEQPDRVAQLITNFVKG